MKLFLILVLAVVVIAALILLLRGPRTHITEIEHRRSDDDAGDE